MRKLGANLARAVEDSSRGRGGREFDRCPIPIFSSPVITSTTSCCRGTLSIITFTNGFCSPNERRRIMSIRARRATSSDAPCAAPARIDAQVEEGRKRKMVHRDFRSARITALVAIVVAMLAMSAPSFAAGIGEEDVPSTSIVPAEAPSSAAPVNSPASSTSPSTAPSGKTWMPAPKRAIPVHHASSKNSVREPEIEPAKARLKVLAGLAGLLRAREKQQAHRATDA